MVCCLWCETPVPCGLWELIVELEATGEATAKAATLARTRKVCAKSMLSLVKKLKLENFQEMKYVLNCKNEKNC